MLKRSALGARALTFATVGSLVAAAAASAAAVSETTQSVPRPVVGTLGWTSAARLWSISAVSPSVQFGQLGSGGAVRWRASAPLKGVTGWATIVAGEDGDMYVGGSATSGKSPIGAVAKLDPASGAVRWLRLTTAPVVAMVRRPGGGIRALTTSASSGTTQLVGVRENGRFELGTPAVPITLPNAERQVPMAIGGDGRTSVLGYRDDDHWYLASLTGSRAWSTREVPRPDDPWASLAPAAAGLWVFGDGGDSGGAVAEVTAGAVSPATLPLGTDGRSCPTSSFGLSTAAFRAAAIAGPDGALWLRAGCFTAGDPDGSASWMRVAPSETGPAAELVSAPASGALAGVSSVVVGPDQALWSLDSDAGKLVRTVVAGVASAPPATARTARRTGRRVAIRLACVGSVGGVCSGRLRVKRGARTVASGDYLVASGTAAMRPVVTRTLSIPRKHARAALRVAVGGRRTTVRVR